MIAHALTIVSTELARHVATFGGNAPHTQLGNVAEVSGDRADSALRDRLLLSVVNIQAEPAVGNLPGHVIERPARQVPPPVLNLAVLLCATHWQYDEALTALSRALTFFQVHSVFTPQTTDPRSLLDGAPVNQLDRLSGFRLVVELCSPSLAEANDLWGMLGGRQYPFALDSVRMLETGSAAAPRGNDPGPRLG